MRNTDIFNQHETSTLGCLLTVVGGVILILAIATAYGLFLGWLLTLVWNNWLIGFTHWPVMPLWVGFVVVFVVSALRGSTSQTKDK